MNRRGALRTIAAVAAAGLAGCAGVGGGDPRTVRMVGLEFRPARVSIAVDRAIEWVNESDIGHTVTAYQAQLPPGGAFFASGGFETEEAARKNLSAGLIEAGETYTHTFETAGEYPYFCMPHEGSGMTGVVTVS